MSNTTLIMFLVCNLVSASVQGFRSGEGETISTSGINKDEKKRLVTLN